MDTVSFLGLPISTCASSPEGIEASRDELFRGVLMLLQYDGNTIGHCDRAEQLLCSGAASSDDHKHGCIVAYALKCQILASIGFPVDLQPLHRAVGEDSSKYHAWELRHLAAVLVFCHDRNFKRAMDLSIEAILLEPRDVFSLRLLFISVFLCGEYVKARALLQHLVFGVINGPEERDHLLALLTSSSTLVELNVGHGVPLVFLPYVVSYYAFTVEESVHITTHITNADYHAGVDDAAKWNTLAIQLIQHLNQYRNTDPFLKALPPFTHSFAMHVVCHIFESRGDPLGGIEAIETAVPRGLWIGTAHLVVHCWWHLALFHLDSMNVGEALRIFDQYVMPAVDKLDPFSMSDATAFLTRAFVHNELDPREDERFAVVEALWQYHVDDPVRLAIIARFPFFHAHLLFTKWMAEDAAFLALPCHNDASPTVTALAKCLSTPTEAPDGLSAAVLNDLVALRKEWVSIGGSSAQRDIIQRVCLFLLAMKIRSQPDALSVSLPTLAHLSNHFWHAVRSIAQLLPNQPYYAKVWQTEVQHWVKE